MKKIVVFAYSEPGYYGLKALINQKANIVAVYTHKDDADEEIWFPSVYELAKKNNIPVFRPEKITDEVSNKIINLKPDLIYSIYFRRLIPMNVLDSAPLGAYNLHGALLPKYRGQTCINWAVVNGETKTGATLHKMTKEADEGQIVSQEEVDIFPEDKAIDIFHKISKITYDIIFKTFNSLITNTAKLRKQDNSKATKFPRRRPKDGEIHWTDSSKKIFNLIRGVTHPFPGAFTFIDDTRILIWWAKIVDGDYKKSSPGTIVSLDPVVVQTGDGFLQLESIQIAGQAEINATQFSLFKENVILK